VKKPITCFGYGITTKSIARHFGPCIFYDDNVNKPFVDAEGNQLRPSQQFDPNYSELEIPSPGMPPYHPLIRKAAHLQSEYDFFADTMPFSVWISGTNGKTTTTQMTEHLLRDKGAVAGGNIGTPLADLDQKATLWVLETSSFTLHYTKKAKPNVYALLPVTPDHLSWHGSYEAYIEDKLTPLKHMLEGETVILPKAFADRQTAAFVIPYENAEDLASFFGFDTSKIKFKGPFLLDALIAMAIDKILYGRCDYERINAFELEPHRQEEFTDAMGRLWVNDTKATNIDATLAALERYKGHKLHLILGGDDKGVELSPLFERLQTLDVTIYTIGSNEARLNALARQYGVRSVLCTTLPAAVVAIAQKHTKKSVALLSPAAASLDQFPSYAARGDLFKEAVSKLS
jgi:UDP-N-acetylmuramoylalanine--D-glutamate ligase